MRNWAYARAIRVLLRSRGLPERGARGATSVEYGLIIGLIAVVILIAVAVFGQSVLGLFDRTAASVSGAAG